MSVPNKSLDKNKRFAGVKANDFVNKTRANETNKSAARPQGWANLGKINSRRIPPPANVPSLKSETGVNSPTYDPTITTTNHGWTSNDNSQTNPTQQQIDSLPINSPTPPSSADIDKPRLPPTWSSITAPPTKEHPPSLLTLNDFPRLATNTTQDRKPQLDSINNMQNPTFRPANLATWKEGGGGGGNTRIQPLLNDMPQVIPTNPGANFYPQQNMRMYPPQMWAYNPYPTVAMHPQPPPPSRLMNSLNDYRSPTILRNKDIDDLSKLTDNTWANTSEQVNYEEKIRFSDDEDILEANPKTSRLNNQILTHSRLIQDDEHVKQMQDNKNSELINALNIAKQRRDEQERHLKNEQFLINNDEQQHHQQKQIPGYQTRPLLTSNEQDNYHTSRTRHDTNNSQSSFTMKSWSDQMDSFNYPSSHEKSGGYIDNEEFNRSHRSPSESSYQSQQENELIGKKSKKPPSLLTKKIQIKPVEKKSNKSNHLNESRTDNRQQSNDNSLQQKSNRYNKQSNNRQQKNSSILNNKNQSVESNDTNTYKTQQRTNLNDHKQRYQNIDTSSIPPLMSVRSDLPPTPTPPPTTTGKLYQNLNQTGSTDYYDDENNIYYNSNNQTHQRYHHNNRGYTALGSYGRYRRSGTVRHQQQYTTYNVNHTSGISSAPTTSSGTRQKKNSTNKKTNQSSEQTKTSAVNVADESNSSPVVKTSPLPPPSTTEEIPLKKSIETPVLTPTTENEKSNEIRNTNSEQKTLNESNISSQTDNNNTSITKTNKKTTTTSTNAKKRTNKEQSQQQQQQNYQQDLRYQHQQAPRHRNNYTRAMQEYETMQMPTAHSYYNTTRRTGHNGRNSHMHDLSTGYYYEHSQSHYNNRYNYSNEQHYPQQQQQQQIRSTNKNSKRGGTSTTNNRQNKQPLVNGNNKNNNYRHHSTSDNDQKEGEEWETASESSVRNGHYDNTGINNSQTYETKSINRGKTPPKKSFSNQRPNARQIFKYTNA